MPLRTKRKTRRKARRGRGRRRKSTLAKRVSRLENTRELYYDYQVSAEPGTPGEPNSLDMTNNIGTKVSNLQEQIIDISPNITQGETDVNRTGDEVVLKKM